MILLKNLIQSMQRPGIRLQMKVCVTKKFSRMNMQFVTPSFYFGGQAGEFIRYVEKSSER